MFKPNLFWFLGLLALSHICAQEEILAQVTLKQQTPSQYFVKWVGHSFADFQKTLDASILEGVSFQKLHLRTGSYFPLSHLPGSIADIPQIKSIPYLKKDKNADGIFNAGDSLYYPALSADVLNTWLDGSETNPFLSRNKFSNQRNYYWVLSTAANPAWPKATSGIGKTEFWELQHYEKDSLLRDNFFALSGSDDYDDETGVEWMWRWLPKEQTHSFSLQSLITGFTKNLPTSAVKTLLYFHPNRVLRMDNTLFGGLSLKDQFSKLELSYFTDNIPGYLDVGVHAYPGFQPTANISLAEAPVHDHRFDAFSLLQLEEPTSGKYLMPSITGEQSFSYNELCMVLDSGKVKAWSNNGLTYNYRGQELVFCPDNVTAAKIEKAGSQYRGIYSPGLFSSVGKANYLIISPESLMDGALELAELRTRSTWKKWNTFVVSLTDIYYQFGSGGDDPVAIRNFLQWAHDLNSTLENVLLLGDGHYDFRSDDAPPQILPFYQRDDLASDDFYALLDSGEALTFGNYDLDLNIGRLPVAKSSQMQIYLSKIKAYSVDVSQGIFRNRGLLLADDFRQGGATFNLDPIYGVINNGFYSGSGTGHIYQAESRGSQIEDSLPSFVNQRVYLQNYSTNSMGAKPQAQNDLIEKWNQGNLISIYYGHGGTNQLADEKFLTDEGVSQLTGFPTIFLAFSCVVGRIDRINYESMTEKLLWNSKGGAIATFSAMRESFSRSNDSLAFYFLGSLFKAGNVTLGEAVRQAKQKLNTSYFIRHNAERYQLYGEPVLQVPSSSFNISVDQPIDTLKALDKIKISGTASVSSGELILRVEEQKKQKIYAWDIIGNDGVNELEENTFVPGRLLYEEKLPIVNGRFVSEWISPKKLSFGDTNATLSLYGFQAGTASSARFLQNGINIWGTSAYADSIVDKSPPTIKALSCFARSKQVEFGPNITLPKAGCLAFLVEDSTGIDFVENPDEGVSIAVKGIQVPTHPSFIEQNGKRALFRYYFPDTVGTFAVNVRASDILGNVQEQEWGVTIASSANTLVSRVYSIPNPMKSYTKFHFQQNATGYAFIKIFNQRGKLVRLLDPVEPGITKWDGRDHWGNILANGLYYYTLTLISEGKRSHQRQKLVISR